MYIVISTHITTPNRTKISEYNVYWRFPWVSVYY